MAWNWRPWAVFAAILVGLFLVFRPPWDLKLETVEVVRWRDLPRTDGRLSGAKPDALFAVVNFKSSTDLNRFGWNYWYQGLYANPHLCREPSNFDLSDGYWNVFDGSGELGPNRAARGPYHIYLELKSSTRAHAADLLHAPEDICFRLRPYFPLLGGWPGFWPPTNEVVIPKQVLVDAIGRQAER